MSTELKRARGIKLHYWEWVAVEPMAAHIVQSYGMSRRMPWRTFRTRIKSSTLFCGMRDKAIRLAYIAYVRNGGKVWT